MKRIILLLLLLPIISNAQTWEWAKEAGGGESEGIYCATDGDRNIYASGNHWGTIHFGTDIVTGAGAYVVKYDNTGSVKWGISTNSIASSSGSLGLATDKFGNEYLLGVHDTTLTFGGYTITNPGAHNNYYFIAKIDSSGNVKWLKNIGNLASYFPVSSNCIATDEKGNIYITCVFSNNATIDGYTVSSSGSNDIFVGKFDSSGTTIWAKGYSVSTTGDAITSGITVTPTHKIYISGYFNSDSLLFDANILIDTSSTHLYSTGYLAKLDSNGNSTWAKGTGGTTNGGDDFTGIISDSNENVYFTGSYYACILNLGSISLPYAPSSYGFLAKYDSAGNTNWVKLMQGQYVLPWAPAMDPCGNVWIISVMGDTHLITNDTIDGHILIPPTINGDPNFIAGWSSSGTFIQASAISSGSFDDPNSIAIDRCGNVYVVADQEDCDTMIIGSDTIINSSEDMFIAKYNPNLGCSICEGSTTLVHNPLQSTVNIYPNPATTSLTITSGENIKTVAITNLLGQTIYTHEYNTDKVEVDVAGLPTGMYLIRINGSEVRKFVKE